LLPPQVDAWLPRVVLALVVVVFAQNQWVQVQSELDRVAFEEERGLLASPGLVDADSELLTIAAVRYFRKHGLLSTMGLQHYDGFWSDTPVAHPSGDPIYTHYLPGPEYALLGLVGLAGDSRNALIRLRLVPSALVLLSVLVLGFVARTHAFCGWRWAPPLVCGLLLVVPGTWYWSLSLYGHSYSTACTLLGLALGFAAAHSEGQSGQHRRLLLAGVALGFVSNYMLLEACFVVCAAPLVAFLLASRRAPVGFGLQVAVAVGIGLTLAFALHLVQVALVFESFSMAVEDQFQTALRRMAEKRPPHRPELLLRLSEAAGQMFVVEALPMLGAGLVAVWAFSQERWRRQRGVAAVALATIAAYVYPMLFKHHAVLHMYRVPRLFVLLYATFILILVAMLCGWSQRDQPSPQPEGT